jgi:tripartite-type tricarboxylate transporter receptor subunit TctC
MIGRFITCVLVAGALCGSRDAASGEAAYPSKPIRVVSPFAPGGGSDVMARLVAQKLSDAFKQTAIVENRAGAGGRVGTEYVARSAPDGYTLLLTGSGSVMIAAALYQKLPYDPVRDLAPITTVATTSFILIVHPSVPARSVRELIALAKSKPGALNYASSGSGAPAHLAAELFDSLTRVKLTHVPYKGTGPAVASVLAGETDLMFSNLLGALVQLRAGKVRPLGVTSLARSPIFPDVPTISEAGVPGFECITYYGVYAPGATPGDIIGQLNAVLVKELQTPETRKRLEADGSQVRTSTPQAFASAVKADIEKWTRVVRAAGIKPDS